MPQESSRAELIKHLSSEIETQSRYVNSLRSRMAFGVLIGPFALFGSALVATKGKFITPSGCLPWSALAVAVLSYLGLGYYGATLDEHATLQCDVWRRALLSVATGEPIANIHLEFHHAQRHAYLVGFSLLLGALGGIAIFILEALPGQ